MHISHSILNVDALNNLHGLFAREKNGKQCDVFIVFSVKASWPTLRMLCNFDFAKIDDVPNRCKQKLLYLVL